MHFAFQDRENLYLVMDLLTGGDLRFHVGKNRRFKENQTRNIILNIKKKYLIIFRIFRCLHCCCLRILA